VIYRVNAHDALNGTVNRTRWEAKSSAISAAKTYFQSGAYLWVDVVAEDKARRITYPLHLERVATDEEKVAICTRYAARVEGGC